MIELEHDAAVQPWTKKRDIAALTDAVTHATERAWPRSSGREGGEPRPLPIPIESGQVESGRLYKERARGGAMG